jgi:pimeloyl-ACP methyl ester carboxylesterase
MPIDSGIYYHLDEGTAERRKPPIILLHGAGGDHLYWPTHVRRLPGYRVYAPDLPGHGKSEGSGMQTIEAYSQAILTWMQLIGLPSAIIVGHSMGSAISLSLALEHPEHVLGLVLIGGGSRLRVNPSLIEGTASQTTYLSAIDTIIKLSFSAQAPEELTQLAARRMAETRFSVLHSDLLACDHFDVTERIEFIQHPTLVMVGEEDRMTPIRRADYLACKIPNAELEIIPRAGHMVMLEQPQAVAKFLLDFVNQLPY